MGRYSGAGLVSVENRAEGILGVQQQQGSNWLKVAHHLPDFGQVYLLVCSSKGECNIDKFIRWALPKWEYTEKNNETTNIFKNLNTVDK